MKHLAAWHQGWLQHLKSSTNNFSFCHANLIPQSTNPQIPIKIKSYPKKAFTSGCAKLINTFGRHQFEVSNFFKLNRTCLQLPQHRRRRCKPTLWPQGRNASPRQNRWEKNADFFQGVFQSDFSILFFQWFWIQQIEGLRLVGSFSGKGYTSSRIIQMKKYGEEVRGS